MFQTLTLGGRTKTGEDATSDLTYLALEATRNLKMEQPTTVLSVQNGTSDDFLLEATKTLIEHGGGLPGFFNDEVMPVSIPPKFKEVLDHDNGVRKGQSMEALAKLRPVFDRHNGTVTAGNASQITDGAVVTLVMEEEKARAMGYKPLGRIKAFAYAGLDPKRMGLGPAYSTKLVLEKAGMTMKDIERVEINEAFAVQVLANMRIFEFAEYSKQYLDMDKPLGAIDPAILNVNGGAIAVGHPVGSSGTRLVHTLLRELRHSDKSIGLATLCVGGGQGAAFVLERLN